MESTSFNPRNMADFISPDFFACPFQLHPLRQVPNYKKTKWTSEEDEKLISSVHRNSTENWSVVAQEIPNRTGKQCRERWYNHHCPSLKKETWSPGEDTFIVQQQMMRGNAWSNIAKLLPGRSPNHVKNRFNYLLKHNPSLIRSCRPTSKPPSWTLPLVGSNSSSVGSLTEMHSSSLTQSPQGCTLPLPSSEIFKEERNENESDLFSLTDESFSFW